MFLACILGVRSRFHPVKKKKIELCFENIVFIAILAADFIIHNF